MIIPNLDYALSRRDFVTRMAAITGAAALGCSDSPEVPSVVTPSLDHTIIVTMENRSFDHLLGWLPGADGRQAGLSFLDKAGAAHSTYHLTSPNGCGLADPNHSYDGGHSEFNGGACDGWLTAPGNDLHAIGYYVAADMPFLGQAAPRWTVLDRYFTAMMGPTFPNRLIALTGQTDRLSNTRVESSLPTIWDRLAQKSLSGRAYTSGFTISDLWGSRYSALIKPIADFFIDAAAGSLPNVAFVDPVLTNDLSDSYHPPGDIRNAEAFLSRVYNAVTTSPVWKSSLLIITFDEWGGFFDHVPPTIAPLPEIERSAGNLAGLRGFRIPTILVSPFVKRGFVSSKLYDHASVLKLIETRWGLEPLTVRDAGANNLGDELDMSTVNLTVSAITVPQGPFAVPCFF